MPTLRLLAACCLAGATSFQLAPALRLPSARRSSSRPWMAEQATEEATKELAALVRELATPPACGSRERRSRLPAV